MNHLNFKRRRLLIIKEAGGKYFSAFKLAILELLNPSPSGTLSWSRQFRYRLAKAWMQGNKLLSISSWLAEMLFS